MNALGSPARWIPPFRGLAMVLFSAVFRRPFGMAVRWMVAWTALVAMTAVGQTLTNGVISRDAISVANAKDSWTFTARAGDNLIFRMGAVGFNPRIDLFGPDNALVKSGFITSSGGRDAELVALAPQEGTYTATVSSYYANGGGTYSLTLARSPAEFQTAPGDQGGPMINGYLHAGELEMGDLDVWSFVAGAGDLVLLRMGAVGFNPHIRLYSPSGALVDASFIASSGGRDTELAARATNAGTYTVVVASYYPNGIGSYTLTLARSPAEFQTAPGDQGGALANGYKQPGSLGVGDLDLWSFAANAGDAILLRMGASAFNPRIRVFGPTGAPVGDAFIQTSGGRDAELSARATNSGTYTVVVSSYYPNVSGTYELTLAQSPGAIQVAPGDQGGELINGFLHTGQLDVGDLDLWSFVASAGDSVLLRMGAVGFNPHIRLYNPSGALVDTSFIATSGGRDTELAARATNAGTYTVVVASNYPNGTGAYNLSLARTPADFQTAPGDEGGALVNGYKQSGSLLVGDLDLWSFKANAGDALILRAGASSFNPQVRLFGPTGALVADSFIATSGGRDTELVARATNGGTYTVVVASYYPNVSGDYDLTLAQSPGDFQVAPTDQGGELVNGFLQPGTLSVGDLDLWRFVANEGDSILLRLGASAFNPRIRLFGPTGALVGDAFIAASGGRDTELLARATNGGPYTVVVGSYYPNASGEYGLTLARSPATYTVAPGDQGGTLKNGFSTPGSIVVGDLDIWDFAANAGDTLILRMGAASFNPHLRLYGPAGGVVGSAFAAATGARDAELVVKAPATGNYALVLGSYYLGGAGEYSVNLARVPSAFASLPGDQGGSITNGVAYDGSIGVGDLDAWTFLACNDQVISFRCQEGVGAGSFSPNLRLYSRTGELLATAQHASLAQLDYHTTNGGPFTLIVSSGTFNVGGSYQLTATGIVDDVLNLCPLHFNGDTTQVDGIGGTPNSEFVLLTTADLTLPPTWVPILTNRFNVYGTFEFITPFPRFGPERFFRVGGP